MWISTFVTGLTLRGMIAPFVLGGPINRCAFETHVEKVLVPELRSGDIVIMDKLSSRKGPGVRQRIEAAGAEIRFLPSYIRRRTGDAPPGQRRLDARPARRPETTVDRTCGNRSGC